MPTKIEKTLDTTLALGFATGIKSKNAKLNTLPPKVKKLLIDDLDSENVRPEDIDDESVRVLIFGKTKKRTVVVAEFSGTPAETFVVQYVVDNGKLVGKDFSVSS